MANDHYLILGVDRNATSDQIKEAYRARARESHPDAGGDKKRFQEVVDAYETLSDDDKRARYDRGESDATRLDVVLNVVRSMIDEAFSRNDPIGFMRGHCDRIRSNNQDTKRREEAKAHSLEVRLKAFVDANSITANQAGRDCIVELLQNRIVDHRSIAANMDKEIQIGTDVLKFLDGLRSPTDIKRGIRDNIFSWQNQESEPW